MKAAILAGATLVAISIFSCNHARRIIGEPDPDARISDNASAMLADGRRTFRFDTFGSEKFFGDKLRLHEAIAGAARGGVGDGLSPKTALEVGLKIDVDVLPRGLVDDLANERVNLDDPGVTLDLLALNAVVGVTGFTGADGRLSSIGIQCALCHSSVDSSLMSGIGHRLDGWANRDLNIGKIVSLAPNLKPFAELLEVDEATVRAVLLAWGPGKFDAQLVLDGKATRPDDKTAATLIPPAFGLAGVNQHTSTGSWGSVTYWNAFVSNLEMHGEGTFIDPRLNDPVKYPVATKAKFYEVRSATDRITAKLGALHFYQLAIPAPTPPDDSFDHDAAARGKILFEGQAKCATCHVPPLYTEPGYNLHKPEDIGIDDFQAQRSPDGRYRTAPLKGLFSHQRGGFYHDGRFATLLDVVNHYDAFFGLALTAAQKNDLVEHLKSL